MNFASDNWAGIAPQINSALLSNSSGSMSAYGDSDLDEKVRDRFSELFEKQVSVFFVGTGTIANALAIASLSKPGGMTLCHREAHIIEDECGATELFSGGGRLVGIDGDFGKIDPKSLQTAIDRFDPNFIHYGQATAISLTQANEAGTIYSLEEIRAIAQIAKTHKLPLHMDGSRFTNALVHLEITPAQMTWKSGVDILSFGGTKNGCWCAEAIVLFNPAMAEQMAYTHKRAGQLYSKMRFFTAQYDAYLKDDLWLNLATHANNMAENLRQKIVSSPVARLGWQTQGNETFCILPKTNAKKLQDIGVKFHPWKPPQSLQNKPDSNEGLYRFVTSFETSREEIELVIAQLVR